MAAALWRRKALDIVFCRKRFKAISHAFFSSKPPSKWDYSEEEISNIVHHMQELALLKATENEAEDKNQVITALNINFYSLKRSPISNQ